jgi:hypothetical protein
MKVPNNSLSQYIGSDRSRNIRNPTYRHLPQSIGQLKRDLSRAESQPTNVAPCDKKQHRGVLSVHTPSRSTSRLSCFSAKLRMLAAGRLRDSGRDGRDSREKKMRSTPSNNQHRPQTTINKSKLTPSSLLLTVDEGTNQTTGRNEITESARCFISTSSTMFFEHDNNINIGKMVPIPISPMYAAEQTAAVNWGTEFFARGATSLPSARNESSLPGLNASKGKIPPRQIFSRQPNASSPTAFEQDVSPRSHPTGLIRPTFPVSKSLSSSTIEVPRNDSEIEPWAYKIISKYHTESTHRPQSRCTTRLRGDHQNHASPPMNIGEMSQSKSCPEFKRTGKLASLT